MNRHKNDRYSALPCDERSATKAKVNSPIMSPEGTPSSENKKSEVSSGTLAKGKVERLMLDEPGEDQILRISTIMFSNDSSSPLVERNEIGKKLGGTFCGKVDFDNLDSKNDSRMTNSMISNSKNELNSKKAPGVARRTLARFFASSIWQKRIKNFIPVTLLILYSAIGGSVFWMLEGHGRDQVAGRLKAQREHEAQVERNLTIDLLKNVIESAHSNHVADRIFAFNFSKLNNTIDNYSLFDQLFLGDSYSSLLNATKNVPGLSNLEKFTELVTDALNHTFRIESDTLIDIDNILFNFTLALPRHFDEVQNDWTYWISIFYAGTIYTTVGYGFYTAATDFGRAATMLYALFGIPLVLYTLNQLGRILVSAIWRCYRWTWKLRNFCCPVQYQIRKTKKVVAEFPFSVAIVITIAWVVMCSAIFCKLENWTFFTSFYFFFQSLTTIGFGDVKPKHPEYLVSSFLLIFIGLALFSMCWSLLQLKFDHLINKTTQKITQKFLRTELEGGRMTMDISTMQSEIEKITAGENAWLAAFLDENRRRVLTNEWRRRAKMSNKFVQTEITQVDRAVQSVADNQETSSQTPQFMSPEHQYHAREVPYREFRRGRDSQQDEFRALLHGIRNIIGECRDTLANKESSSSESRSQQKEIHTIPRTPEQSTSASVTMLEL